MKAIKFTYYDDPGRSGYKCSEPGEMSGEYFASADVEEALDCLRDVIEHNQDKAEWPWYKRVRQVLANARKVGK